jgi:hypothetical protein
VNVEEQIDELYGLPLDQFIAARDRLASSLRADGSRGDAERVKRLAKPNLVAWALNRVRRREPELVARLLAAGARLREAQRELVGGGDRDALRVAAADERRLIEEVVTLAESQLEDGGRRSSAASQSKLRATVHAAAADDEVGEAFRAGRLSRDHQISDLGLSLGAASGEPARTRKRGGAGTAGARKPDRAQRERERMRRTLNSQLERARADARDLDRQADTAERQAARARRDADRAALRVAELERSLAALGDPR